jgi:hypothetical protein
MRMTRSYSPLGGVAFASLAAGPIFTFSYTLAAFYLRLPDPVAISPGDLLPWFAVLILSVFVGAILAVVPNVIGCSMMAALAETGTAARTPEAWVAAGAAAGTGIAVVFGVDWPSEMFIALVATGAVCAGICRGLAALD